jgi:hypothetical protein
MKKGYLSGILAFFAVFFLISIITADGGYFPHPGYWVSPGQQRAVIFYENNVETMIVTSGFTGNAKDLVWIIPTPTKPEVTKANENVFQNIAKLTRQQYSGRGFGYAMMEESIEGTSSGVVVLESKQVDYYDVNVLSATSSEDLVKWFKDNDYSYPDDYSYVLNYYISKGWYFTAIKVSPESAGAMEVIQDMKEGNPTPIKMVFLSDRIVFPLKISSIDFSDGFMISTNLEMNNAVISNLKDVGYDKLVIKETAVKEFNQIILDSLAGVPYQESIASNYSLIIQQYNYDNLKNQYCSYDSCIRTNLEDAFRSYFSRNGIYLNYNGYNSGYTPISIYVIADAKYEADNFYVSYGNWVKKKQIIELGDDANGKPFIAPTKSKYYLTYLSANMQKSQMDEDLYLRKSGDNLKVNAGPETWQIFIYGLLIGLAIFTVWIITPFGILFVAGTLILFLSKNTIARVFGWIMEIFSLVITFFIWLIIFVLVIFNRTLGNYVALSIIITLLLLIVVMVLLIGLEIKYANKTSQPSTRRAR